MTRTRIRLSIHTLLYIALLGAASTSTRGTRQCTRAASATTPSTKLFHLQCRRRHARPSKQRKSSSSTSPIGSLLSIRQPTTELVSRWFRSCPASDGGGGASACAADDCFNHEEAGMTNPCLHVDLTSTKADSTNSRDRTSSSWKRVVQVSSMDSTSSSTASSKDCTQDDENNALWWPACPSPGDNNNSWRVLVFRRRIGYGRSCYTAVRDAALEWEFHANDADVDVGIVQVQSQPSSRHSQQLYQRRDSYGTGYDIVHNMSFGDGNLYESSRGAMQIWSGPGGRRLATYSRVFPNRWMPRIYTVNPVTVVYDLVDQRGQDTTYTSTAYATCRGHWLRGEERVTVAHRDDGNVDVEILSYSKHGNSLWARMIWPFVGPMQGRFFDCQMQALQQVATQHSRGNEEMDGAILLNVKNLNGRAARCAGRTPATTSWQ